jgi:hypothetical protein
VLGVYLDQLASSKTDKFGTIHRYLNDPSELCFGIDAAAVTREAEEEWGK